MWPLMSSSFRLAVAQTVLGRASMPQPRLNEIAADLSLPVPTRQDVSEFYQAAQTVLQRACGVSPDLVAPGTTTRIEAPSYEVVRLYLLTDLSTDKNGLTFLPPGKSAGALTLITTIETDDAWLMAGVGAVMAPGWPPTVAWTPPSQT